MSIELDEPGAFEALTKFAREATPLLICSVPELQQIKDIHRHLYWGWPAPRVLMSSQNARDNYMVHFASKLYLRDQALYLWMSRTSKSRLCSVRLMEIIATLITIPSCEVSTKQSRSFDFSRLT
jgi:hypothetical protein